jgi:sensor histidine kinase YesM
MKEYFTTAKLKEYAFALLIAVVGSTVLTYFTCTSCSSSADKFLFSAVLSAIMWVCMWIGNSELTHFIDQRISWVEAPVKRFIIGMITTVIFTVLVAVGLMKIWEYTRDIKFSTYSDFVVSSLIITFLISFFLHGRAFLLNWRKLELDAAQLRNENLNAKYESLKSQLDPHFLFNSLNVLTNLIYTNPDKSARFIKQLSEVYRYVLEVKSRELVSLADELKFVESYLFLQHIRFGDKLIVQNSLTGTDGLIPPLALQILVENSIKHNVISEEDPLTIKLYADANFMVVENNLQVKVLPHEDSTGIGLDNIAKRYEFVSDQKMVIEKTPEVFRVKLPLIENN